MKLLTDVPFSEEDMQLVRDFDQGTADEDLDHGKGEGAHEDDVEPCGKSIVFPLFRLCSDEVLNSKNKQRDKLYHTIIE